MDGRPPGLFIYYRQEDFSGLDIEQLFKHLTCVEHRIWSRRNSIADGYAIDSRGENLLHIVEGYSRRCHYRLIHSCALHLIDYSGELIRNRHMQARIVKIFGFKRFHSVGVGRVDPNYSMGAEALAGFLALLYGMDMDTRHSEFLHHINVSMDNEDGIGLLTLADDIHCNIAHLIVGSAGHIYLYPPAARLHYKAYLFYRGVAPCSGPGYKL